MNDVKQRSPLTFHKRLRPWRAGLHVMFAFLLLFGLLRAGLDERLDARALGLAVALAVVYALRRVLPRALWLVGLCVLWCGLMVHAQDFMWLEFPLVFAFLSSLPRWPGIACSGLLWALAAFLPAWQHPAEWTIAAAIGPFIGTAFAIGAFHAGRMVQAEAAHHAEVARQLRATQAELAASEHQAGRLEERERLSREIHDTVAQGLSSIVLLSRAAQKDPSPETLALIEKVASENLSEARRFVSELAAPAPSLEEALQQVVDSAAAQAAALGKDTDIELVVSGESTVPEAHRQDLLRAAQEGLNNMLKHSGARRAVVTLGCFKGETTLDIVDDGEGMDPTSPSQGGFGLRGLRQRVEGHGGTLTVESSPGEGTALAIRIPQKVEDQDA